MRKTFKITILTFLTAVLLTNSISAYANNIPRQVIPDGTPQAAVDVTEKIIGNTLSKVQNGYGYAPARIEVNNAIRTAVLANKTNGYGYGLLAAIANNAIYESRDIYLRPAYYKAAEQKVKLLISDLITAVQNKTMTYEAARKEAYTRIYRSINPNFNPDSCLMTDFCYWDIPVVDSAMFNRARKLLLNAKNTK